MAVATPKPGKSTAAADRARTLKSAKEYTAIQGEVIYAANLLHQAFYRLFLVALSLERPDEFGATIRFYDHALAIWHVIQSDNSQREMAITAISTVPTELKLQPALHRLSWAKDKAIVLASYRNVAAHNPVMFRGQLAKDGIIEFVPQFGGDGMRPAHARRLKIIQGLAFWKTLRNDLFNLSRYVEAINLKIEGLDYERRGAQFVNAPQTWPDRPQLRSLPQIQALDRRLSQEGIQPARRTRRRSSRK